VHWDLLAQARDLATRDATRPRQVNLRRAVSSAYYTLFHYLIDAACRLALGTRHADAPFRYVLGRAFTHGAMRQACASYAGGTLRTGVARGLPARFSIPAQIRLLAETFVLMQDERNLAEYDRNARFQRPVVLTLVGRVEPVLRNFIALPKTIVKKFFLLCLLTWPTLAGR
jgi:hypothetical protein